MHIDLNSQMLTVLYNAMLTTQDVRPQIIWNNPPTSTTKRLFLPTNTKKLAMKDEINLVIDVSRWSEKHDKFFENLKYDNAFMLTIT